MQTKLLINGEFVKGEGKSLSIIDPVIYCDMSVYGLDAYTAVQPVMVAHS